MPLDSYPDFSSKNILFEPDVDYPDNKISDIPTFNKWYNNFVEPGIYENNNFNYFFRGMSEAKHKLFNSAQREWIANNMQGWRSDFNYLQFIKGLIQEAKKKPLFKNVLAYYQINYDHEADFPILSILQHYGLPTPLMDWTYNLDVALYFATDNVNVMSASDNIDGYFSIYMINKQENENLRNIFEFSQPDFPNLNKFHDGKFDSSGFNFVCYLSDFEMNIQPVSTLQSQIPAQYSLQRNRPLTTYYNQNIIPQQGLFVFNPNPVKPLEEIFNTLQSTTKRLKVGSLSLSPFFCYNIRKDLADYIRRKISKRFITNSFIYPDLRNFLKQVKENVFNDCFS